MLRQAVYSLILLLVGCGPEPGRKSQAVDLPLPSGPPVAQQVDAVPIIAPDQAGPAWEIATSGAGTALRLMGGGGKLLLSIACAGSPRRLAVTAPAFDPVGSEDRFSFGLGSHPLTLVADLSKQANGGVTGEAPVPEDFAQRLETARRLSALYGNQAVGPVPAPDQALKQILAKSCSPQG